MIGIKIGHKLIELKETDSTNSYASRLLHTDVPEEGLAVMAHYQRAGKGQRGSGWESEQGKNLLVSYILYPDFLAASDHFLLNQCISLALKDFILSQTSKEVFIKWPNDLIIENKKIAGILVENALRNGKIVSSIVGMGINLNQIIFNIYSPEAVSLKLLEGKTFDLKKCLALLNESLQKWYILLKIGNHEKIRSEYLHSLFLFRQTSLFESKGNKFRGTINGVLNDGRLEISTDNGEVNHYINKEVRYIFDQL